MFHPSFLRVIIVLVLLISSSFAQSREIVVRGVVRDIITGQGVDGASVMIMDKDSAVVAQATAKIPFTYVDNEDGSRIGYKDKNSGAAFELAVAANGPYTIYVSMQGYEHEAADVEIAPKNRNKPIKIEDILLLPKARELNDVTVTGTKLKVYHNGDTLVYDAGAFVVDNRSMLEDLVKILPGVELRDGRIFANGRYVDNIVIGGKDFMQSSPEQIMKMLPAYVVDKLKFYDKSGERSKTMGRDMDDKSYVMDVSMKRDYHGAWFGYAGTGGGTKKRWSLTDLTMLYDDRQALTVSADANNVGEIRELSKIATSTETYGDRELRDMHAEISYAYHPTERFKLGVRSAVKRRDTDQGRKQSYSANLATPNNIFRRSMSSSDLTDIIYSGGISLAVRPRSGIYGKLAYNINYDTARGEEYAAVITSDSEVNASDSLFLALLSPTPPSVPGVTNAYKDISLSRDRKWSHSASAETHIACGDNLLRIKGALNSDHSQIARRRDFSSRVFEENIQNTLLDNLFNTRISGLKTDAEVDYSINYADNTDIRGILTPFYNFEWMRNRDGRSILDISPIDETESMFASLNSRRIVSSTGRHSVGAELKHEFRIASGRWITLSAKTAAALTHTDVSCVTADNHSNIQRDFLLLIPEFGIKWCPVADDRKGSTASVELKCQLNQTSPDGADLADFTDSSDPMNIISGNPDLRKQTAMNVSLALIRYFKKWETTIHATLSHRELWDAIGLRSVYNGSNGVRITKPVNTDSWRETSLEMGYGRPLLYNQTLWLNASASGRITHCADLVSDSQDMTEYPYMSISDYSASLSIRCNTKNRKIGGSYSLSLRGSAVSRTSSPGSSLHNLGNRISIDLKLPAGISARANCDIVSRFGYAMPSLNKTVALLNAKISKSFLNGKLDVTLSANDLLCQRTPVSYTINGEGSTETVNTRYTPSYVMLSVHYDWSHMLHKKRDRP